MSEVKTEHFRSPKLLNLERNLSESWRRLKQHFKLYLNKSGTSTKEKKDAGRKHSKYTTSHGTRMAIT